MIRKQKRSYFPKFLYITYLILEKNALNLSFLARNSENNRNFKKKLTKVPTRAKDLSFDVSNVKTKDRSIVITTQKVFSEKKN